MKISRETRVENLILRDIWFCFLLSFFKRPTLRAIFVPQTAESFDLPYFFVRMQDLALKVEWSDMSRHRWLLVSLVYIVWNISNKKASKSP